MTNRYYTPIYNALYKKLYTFGVSGKLFAIELALSGIFAFVMHLYFLLVFVFLVHITVAILNKKEPAWIDIFKFLMKVPDENYAILS